MTLPAVHVVLPGGVDDPLRPSGGNVYDRRVCAALATAGRAPVEHHVLGTWPRPGPAALGGLHEVLTAHPDGTTVLLDGLVACCAPDVMRAQLHRLHTVVLVHLPLGVEDAPARSGEAAVLAGCDAVVTTSAWTRAWLLTHYRLDPTRVVVVRPGADAPRRRTVASSTADGRALLVVGRVCRAKGHDLLVEALAEIAELAWRCTWVGSADSDPGFVALVRDRLAVTGIAHRVELRGPMPPARMAVAYAAADLLVVPSRFETYGMVITEAIAHGIPVVASDVGGVREALEGPAGGTGPGLLVAPADVATLASALRDWLTTAALRARLRCAVTSRQEGLETWGTAARRLGAVLDDVGAASSV